MYIYYIYISIYLSIYLSLSLARFLSLSLFLFLSPLRSPPPTFAFDNLCNM